MRGASRGGRGGPGFQTDSEFDGRGGELGMSRRLVKIARALSSSSLHRPAARSAGHRGGARRHEPALRHGLRPPGRGRPGSRDRRGRARQGGGLLGRPVPVRSSVRLDRGRGRSGVHRSRGPRCRGERGGRSGGRPRRRDDRGRARLLRHRGSPVQPLRPPVRRLPDLRHRGDPRLQSPDARRLRPGPGEGPGDRSGSRWSGPRGHPLDHGAHGLDLVALGLGGDDRLQPLRRLDLPGGAGAALQQVHAPARR